MRAALLISCWSALASAQTWPTVTTSDLVVVPQSTVGRVYVTAGDDGSGGTWLAWSDRRPNIGTENAIWGQHLDRDGGALWPTASTLTDGIQLIELPGDDTTPLVVSLGAAGFYLVWVNGTTAQVMRFDGNGVSAWSLPSQVTLGDAAVGATGRLFAEPDGLGGLLVLTSESMPNPGVRVHRIRPDGTKAWNGGSGVTLHSGQGAHDPALVPDGTGGAFVAWCPNYTTDQIRVQRIDASGVPQWAPLNSGIGIADPAGPWAADWTATLAAVSDGSGGVYVAWSSRLSVAGDIYAQQLRSDGGAVFLSGTVPVPRALMIASGDQQHLVGVSDSAGGAIFAWQSGTAGAVAQRILVDGGAAWAPNGQNIFTVGLTFHAYNPNPLRAKVGPDGNIFFLFRTGFALRAEKLTPAGVAQWSGPVVSSVSGGPNYGYADLVPDCLGGAVYSFSRFGFEVGAKRVRADGTLGPSNGGVDFCPVADAGPADAGPADAGPVDAGPVDAGPVDAGPVDAGPVDAGPVDAGPVDSDAGASDAGAVDAGAVDAGAVDSGAVDAGDVDAGLADAGDEAGSDAGPAPSAPRPLSFYSWGCGCTSTSGVLTLFPLLLWASRRRSRTGPAAGVLLAVLTFAGASFGATPPPRPTLIFTGLTAREGVSESLATTLSDVVQSQLVAEQAWAVRSAEDLSAVLGVERQRQLLGCSDAETSCLAELAGAFDAQRLVRGSVAKLGESLLLTLVLIDLTTGRPLSSITERLRGAGNMDAMLDAVATIVKSLHASDAAVAPVEASTPLEEGLGLVVGLRGDVDVLGPGIAPGLFASWSRGFLGLGVGVIIAPLPGARAEVRFIILPAGRVRPWVGAGATFFYPWLAPRGAVGATAQLGPIQLGADVALEYFPAAPGSRTQVALLLGLSAGYRF